jgi:hypothetical protein
VRGAAHPGQNFAPAGAALLQAGHRRASGAAHSMQKRAEFGFS